MARGLRDLTDPFGPDFVEAFSLLRNGKATPGEDREKLTAAIEERLHAFVEGVKRDTRVLPLPTTEATEAVLGRIDRFLESYRDTAAGVELADLRARIKRAEERRYASQEPAAVSQAARYEVKQRILSLTSPHDTASVHKILDQIRDKASNDTSLRRSLMDRVLVLLNESELERMDNDSLAQLAETLAMVADAVGATMGGDLAAIRQEIDSLLGFRADRAKVETARATAEQLLGDERWTEAEEQLRVLDDVALTHAEAKAVADLRSRAKHLADRSRAFDRAERGVRQLVNAVERNLSLSSLRRLLELAGELAQEFGDKRGVDLAAWGTKQAVNAVAGAVQSHMAAQIGVPATPRAGGRWPDDPASKKTEELLFLFRETEVVLRKLTTGPNAEPFAPQARARFDEAHGELIAWEEQRRHAYFTAMERYLRDRINVGHLADLAAMADADGMPDAPDRTRRLLRDAAKMRTLNQELKEFPRWLQHKHLAFPDHWVRDYPESILVREMRRRWEDVAGTSLKLAEVEKRVDENPIGALADLEELAASCAGATRWERLHGKAQSRVEADRFEELCEEERFDQVEELLREWSQGPRPARDVDAARERLGAVRRGRKRVEDLVHRADALLVEDSLLRTAEARTLHQEMQSLLETGAIQDEDAPVHVSRRSRAVLAVEFEQLCTRRRGALLARVKEMQRRALEAGSPGELDTLRTGLDEVRKERPETINKREWELTLAIVDVRSACLTGDFARALECWRVAFEKRQDLPLAHQLRDEIEYRQALVAFEKGSGDPLLRYLLDGAARHLPDDDVLQRLASDFLEHSRDDEVCALAEWVNRLPHATPSLEAFVRFAGGLARYRSAPNATRFQALRGLSPTSNNSNTTSAEARLVEMVAMSLLEREHVIAGAALLHALDIPAELPGITVLRERAAAAALDELRQLERQRKESLQQLQEAADTDLVSLRERTTVAVRCLELAVAASFENPDRDEYNTGLRAHRDLLTEIEQLEDLLETARGSLSRFEEEVDYRGLEPLTRQVAKKATLAPAAALYRSLSSLQGEVDSAKLGFHRLVDAFRACQHEEAANALDELGVAYDLEKDRFGFVLGLLGPLLAPEPTDSPTTALRAPKTSSLDNPKTVLAQFRGELDRRCDDDRFFQQFERQFRDILGKHDLSATTLRLRLERPQTGDARTDLAGFFPPDVREPLDEFVLRRERGLKGIAMDYAHRIFLNEDFRAFFDGLLLLEA